MKRLIDYALNQPLFILLGTLLFVMAGVFAFKNLSVEAFPDVTDTQVTVIALYPGRAAEEVEKEVSLPIEVALSGLPNSIRVFSHTQFGLSFTVVTYNDNAEVNLVRQQVNERLRGIQLPEGVEAQIAPNATPVGEIMRYRLRGDGLSTTELRTLQDWTVERSMRQVPGVADVVADWRIQAAAARQFPLYAADPSAAGAMRDAGLELHGSLDDLLEVCDIVVDCTPKRVGARNAERYRTAGKRFILHGGEKHDITGHSFVAEANYASAVGRDSTRVVSCNTTSIVRTLGALKRAGLLRRARGTLLRRATDPWESHLGGLMNTVLPEPSIPSHQGPDARGVDAEGQRQVAPQVEDALAVGPHVQAARGRPAGRGGLAARGADALLVRTALALEQTA